MLLDFQSANLLFFCDKIYFPKGKLYIGSDNSTVGYQKTCKKTAIIQNNAITLSSVIIALPQVQSIKFHRTHIN